MGGAERWRGEGKGDCFTCCQRALISPAVCWSPEVRPRPPGALPGWAVSLQSCIESWPKWRLIEGNGYWRPNHSETPSVTLKPVHSVNVRSRGTHLAPLCWPLGPLMEWTINLTGQAGPCSWACLCWQQAQYRAAFWRMQGVPVVGSSRDSVPFAPNKKKHTSSEF